MFMMQGFDQIFASSFCAWKRTHQTTLKHWKMRIVIVFSVLCISMILAHASGVNDDDTKIGDFLCDICKSLMGGIVQDLVGEDKETILSVLNSVRTLLDLNHTILNEFHALVLRGSCWRRFETLVFEVGGSKHRQHLWLHQQPHWWCRQGDLQGHWSLLNIRHFECVLKCIQTNITHCNPHCLLHRSLAIFHKNHEPQSFLRRKVAWYRYPWFRRRSAN